MAKQKKETNLLKLANKKSNDEIIEPKNNIVIKKQTTPEEDRDIKAKQTVEKLLEDIPLISKEKKEELIEIAPEDKVINTGATNKVWLKEQIDLLSSENENLRIELETAKNNYTKIFEELQRKRENNSDELINETIKQNIFALFNELQCNFLGQNPEKRVWPYANIKILLDKMITYFPFTANIKRF